ncbi:MAG: tetratricopeptide repeat protein [Deltaproteobacteria bacterium]|nr:tetratricopeptide repeat protein [Deltaproteobacteria bacterium]
MVSLRMASSRMASSRTLALSLALSLAAATVAASHLCYAAPADPKATTEAQAGRTEFERGLRYFRAQEYRAALPHLRRAYELSGKRPSTILALAQCERALEQLPEAITHFHEYLATKPGEDDARKVQETVQLLEEIVADREKAKAAAENAAKPAPTPAPPPIAPATAPAPAPAPAATPAQPPPPPPSPAFQPAASPPAVLPPSAEATVEPKSRSVLASPILWIAVGAAVVGGAIAIGFAASGSPEYYRGTSDLLLTGPT